MLAARRAGLSSATGLALESHLDDCARCRKEADALDQLVRAVDTWPTRVMDERSRNHALEVALEQSRPGSDRKARRVLAPWVATAAVLCLGVVGYAVLGTDAGPSPDVRVLSGALVVDGRPTVAGETRSQAREIRMQRAATVALGRARLSAPAGTQLRWHRDLERVELVAGEVEVQVEHRDVGRFVVQNRRFTVEVTGTRFVVDGSSVRVQEGSVRVTGAGREVLAELTAGESFAVEPSEPRSVAPTEAGDSQVAPAGPPLAARAEERPADAPGLAPVRAVGPGGAARAGTVADSSAAPPAAALSQARRLLAERKHRRAARGLRRLLRGQLTRTQRAEAEMLLGDSARIAGRLRVAAEQYGSVARRYGDLAPGRQALFAAAQAAAAAGDRARATRYLRAYLRRHPKGTFAPEARRQLGALGGTD